jgi:ribosomal protein S18 acetylase RimI-like enzyme
MELDRSIPFYNLILRCDSAREEEIRLPEGYRLQSYRPGFEGDWAEMEWQLGDFPSRQEAEEYFRENYMGDSARLAERGIFVTDQRGTVVGSCLAWQDERQGKPVASLHWLFVSPAHQRRGIGKALCLRALEIYREKGEFPVYIHTQPWSWKAVLLYVSLGFQIQKEDSFSNYVNQYEEATATLETVLSPEQFRLVMGEG